MESVPDWSALVPDLLVEIGTRISSVEDFMAFRAVCTSWRLAASMDKFVAEFAAVGKSWQPRVPWLMLAEKKDSDKREFYSLSKAKISMTLSLPQTKGKRCIGVGFGWLLTLTCSGEVNLLNPFCRAQIQLPNFRIFPVPPKYVVYDYPSEGYYPECNFIVRAVLSANPSDTSEFVLFVIAGPFLGFWKAEDKNWTRIESGIGGFASITHYDQKLYAINYGGNVWVWDPSGADLNAHLLFTVDRRLIDWRMPYFVESCGGGELLLITRDGCEVKYGEDNYGATNFGVIRLDVMKREWKRISGLKKDAIFIGNNGAFSVAASNAIKPNCIYFTDDCNEAWDESEGGGKDMGIYNVEDQTIQRFDIESLSYICPPLWIAPSFCKE